MGVLKTLAIIFLVYYIFKFFSRYIAPIFLKKVMQNVEQKFREQQENQNNTTTEGKVGETVIDKKPNQPKESKKTVGDYVDFEEVNDKNS